ncbi:hypothetical protein [Nocardiopsis composta]|uniref:Uncharacterized protein n=1 Tax=Nocardiopsis composta TaxID=157465 RepID=A0A7W8QTK9_9ACTN|nr:hypothetical protein [Nocardiopsis composta]MBB5436325.1 hypothetical protein [Nocardiopsis composta]
MDTTSPPGPVDVNDAAEAVVTALRDLATSVEAGGVHCPEDVADTLAALAKSAGVLPGILEGLERWIRAEAAADRITVLPAHPRSHVEPAEAAAELGVAVRAGVQSAGMAQIALETGRGAVAGLARRTEQSVGA